MDWKITLSDIDLGEAEITNVTRVLSSRWLSMGEVTREFERRFAAYLNVKYAFAVSNGTAALHLANMALGIGPGDEVIVPALTFVATSNAILYCGATPIFADITSLDNLNISPEAIAAKITPRTRAICVVHYGGYPVDMDYVTPIAQKHNLFVIEDAAHAPGAEYHGRKAGTLGDVGCFSFFANKNLATGEGGMVVTDSDALAEQLTRLRSHGMTSLSWERHQGHVHSYDVTALGRSEERRVGKECS
jgi:dTDP-4-amino-4,6-dideoxygalactose transaminase